MRVVIGYDPNAGSHARVAREVCESMGITVVDMRGEDPIYANTAIHAANMIVRSARLFAGQALACRLRPTRCAAPMPR